MLTAKALLTSDSELVFATVGSTPRRGEVTVRGGKAQEAAAYFALLALAGGSETRADRWLAMAMCQGIDIGDWPAERLSLLLGAEPEHLQKLYQEASRGIESLPEDCILCTPEDAYYPALLRDIPGRPPYLFLRGDVSLDRRVTVSVVGTRGPSPEGRERAYRLAAMLVKRGVVVVSGLARGIDTAAHLGALDAGGPTVAVLGTPVTKSYPAENRSLQERIAREGLLVSQFAPSVPTMRFNFPKRNAVMSGMSTATVVVEASETSGALIQARQCLKQGRRLFIPHSAVADTRLNWPRRFLKHPGASEFHTVDQLMRDLSPVIGPPFIDSKRLADSRTLVPEPEGVR